MKKKHNSQLKVVDAFKHKGIEIDILNLEDNGLPVNKLLNVFREDLNVNLESLNMQLTSTDKMAKWALSDWANAWKSPIPTKIKDSSGIEVELSNIRKTSVFVELNVEPVGISPTF